MTRSTDPRPQSRVRRLASHPMVRLVTGVLTVVLALAIGNLILSFTGSESTLLRVVVTISIVHVAYLSFVRLMERRPAVEFHRWSAGRELTWGVLCGAALVASVVGVLYLVGAFRVDSWLGWGGVRAAFAIAAMAAYVEEVLVRGLLFRCVEEMTGTVGALALTAVVFGAIHLGNPASTAWAATAVALEAGLLLGAAYVVSRRLWLPIGLHLGWNFTQGGIFGFSVSGTAGAGLLQPMIEGPAWLTGGAFGPEASVVAVVFCTGVAGILIWHASRQKRLMTPAWKRRAQAASSVH